MGVNHVIIWGNSFLGRRSSKVMVGILKCCRVFEEGQWGQLAGAEEGRRTVVGVSVRQVTEQIILCAGQGKGPGLHWAEEWLILTYIFRGLFWFLWWEGSASGRKQWEQIRNYCHNLARDAGGLDVRHKGGRGSGITSWFVVWARRMKAVFWEGETASGWKLKVWFWCIKYEMLPIHSIACRVDSWLYKCEV